MFKIHVNDGQSELPSDDICYIVAKEGIFLKKRLGIMESIAPVKNISILESVSASARMNINPLPAATTAKIMEFFREVHRQYTSEAIVLLFYNEETGKYRVLPPKQAVTYGGIDYDRNITIEGYTMIGDIHSHGSMSAFHSGVDDSDEESFDGLHITFGNVADEEISISGSIVSNGYRFMVNPEDYLMGLKKVKDIDEVEKKATHKIYRYVNGKMQLDEKATARSSYSVRKYDKRYITLVPPSKRQFNASWMNLVEKGTYRYVYGRAGSRGYGWANYAGGNYWGGHFDADAWRGYRKVGVRTSPGAQTPLALPPGQTPVTVRGTENLPDDVIPCLTCKHRTQKLLLEEEDAFEDTMYQCKKCGIVISEDSDPLECPTCKTDEHLIELTEDELIDNHQRASNEALKGEPEMEGDVIGTYKCYSCKASYPVFKSDTHCPFCQVVLPTAEEIEAELKCQTYDDPNDPANYPGLDKEADRANEEALRQAAAAEELIPDPAKGTTPIQPPKKDGTLMQMFKKAFGGKGGNA
jgi:PRTRC genetic system protein A